MRLFSLIMIGWAGIGLESASAHINSCADEIAHLEMLVDESMGNPLTKPTVPQSIDAQLHHQPTQNSLRRAEENAKSRFASLLARARTLNADGKITECIQSVAEAKRLLGVD
jgi:hypothetical protein